MAKDPSLSWVDDQIAQIEASGDTATVDVNGMKVVVVTVTGRRSGKPRKVPVMRVEKDGKYAVVASKGGAPEQPQWYHSLVANPEVTLQDGTENRDYTARLLTGADRHEWWLRAIRRFPPYAEYQVKTQREIPVFLLEPR